MCSTRLLWIVWFTLACLLSSSCADAVAQDKGRPSLVTDPQKLLDLTKFARLPSVKRELKLTEAQITELAAIEEESKKRVSDIVREVPKLEGDDRKAAFRELQEEAALAKSLAERVFTAEQMQRAKQLAFQYISRSSGSGYGLLLPAVIKELNLTDAQVEAARTKSEEIARQLKTREAEMKVELEEMRMKLQTELVNSLDPMQRARMKSLLGELVTLED